MINPTLNKIENYWFEKIPCLHRLHDGIPKVGAHKIQHRIGMSLSLKDLDRNIEDMLSRLSIDQNMKQRALLTFDDGHKDVLLSFPILQNYPEIQPVLFLTGKQLCGDSRALPLTALYKWCFTNNMDLTDLEKYMGFNRQSLKLLPEDEQRSVLENKGIDTNPIEEEMVSSSDIDLLMKNGWIIGYHGPEHCDLQIFQSNEIEKMFLRDIKYFKGKSFVPWFAWPEGRYNEELARIAKSAGFITQFGLESVRVNKSYIYKRRIWK
ncbi:MAG: polysaccharide deacetylase family protein [Deltaproteobacteria bacterium]|nr:polysaccharide deacetylase family protein [Deltaproteobacteria bacterium]